MPVQRRNKTVKNKRFKSAAFGFILVVMIFIALTMIAGEWLNHTGAVVVQIDNCHITSNKDILALADISDTATLKNIDLLRVERNVEKNPFVKSVQVTAVPPRTVQIHVEERKPFVHLLAYNNADLLLDDEGVVMPTTHDQVPAELPIITGEHLKGYDVTMGSKIDNKHIQNALMLLRTARALDKIVFMQLSEVHLRTGKDILLYTTDHCIPVVFGSADRSSQKLDALRAFLNDESVRAEKTQIKYIDLRFRNQVVVRWDT